MKKMKIMTIVGTRPELIKLSRIINELDKNSNHLLVHTGQNYADELNKIFFDELEIRPPDYYLDAAEENSLQTISQVISKVDPVLEKRALMQYLYTEIQIAVYQQSQQKGTKYQFFIWKLEIDLLMKGFLKKSIEELLII